MRRRHWLALLGLVLLVVVPVGASIWYLWTRAADQYASEAAFSVRHEEGGATAAGLLGGLAQLTGSAPSPDVEILWQLLHSQDFVAGIDAALDLRALWSRPGTSWATGDPVFAFDPSGTIEDLADYWARMVRVSSDAGSGLVMLRVLAFRPEDATAIAREILARSEVAINALNAAARADALRHADDDLALAVERLKDARAALTQFRNLHQIVDPGVDLQAQSGLIGSLEEQLAQAMIEADLLAENAAPGDPRLVQGRRRIAVIEARIADERRRLGTGAGAAGDDDLAALVGDYERLQVDAEFARESWLAAMAAGDAARAGAARQSRYLVAHVPPGMAESARYPARLMIVGLVALFSMLAWAILVLVAWSLRDRR
ncbi:MAG: capsule biosynthesis protein [Rubellimicrobium sp.]|nr:capsule biosynthesis protein [Rubellimicrobium sp.]